MYITEENRIVGNSNSCHETNDENFSYRFSMVKVRMFKEQKKDQGKLYWSEYRANKCKNFIGN